MREGCPKKFKERQEKVRELIMDDVPRRVYEQNIKRKIVYGPPFVYGTEFKTKKEAEIFIEKEKKKFPISKFTFRKAS